MSFLKLPISRVVISNTTTPTTSSIIKITSSKFNNKNNNNNNEQQRRYYSSFSMRSDLEEPKPFNFKPILALLLVGGVGGFLYNAWDNQDLMFSSKLPYQREELDKFKTLMKELKDKKDQQLQLTQQQQQEKEKEKATTEETQLKQEESSSNNNDDDSQSNITFSSANDKNNNSSDSEEKKLSLVHLVESIQDNNNKNNENSNDKNEFDEINADERDDDQETIDLNNEISRLLNEHKDQDSTIAASADKDGIENDLHTIVVEAVESEPTTTEKSSQSLEGTITEREQDLITEIIDGVLSIIPIPIKSAEESVENVLKLLEKQYLEMVQTLITENVKLKEEVENIVKDKEQDIKKVESKIKQKYRDVLDLTIEELNKDLDSRLKDMDNFIKENLGDNQKVLSETLSKQKNNLINIFNQQAESIKQSELEKRAITQLTQAIVDIQKLLNNSTVIDGTTGKALVTRSLKNLTDLSQYDQLIKELLKSLPDGFEKKSVIAMDKLSNDFNQIAKQIRKSTLLVDPNDHSLIGKAVSELASLFIIPEKGMVKGNDYDAILSRAEEYLRNGNLSNAIKEMESINNNNNNKKNLTDINHHLSNLTNNWIKQAKERDQLENISKLLELKLELIHKQQQDQKQQQ